MCVSLGQTDRGTKTKHFANISITKQNINNPFLWWVNNYSLGWDGAAIIQLISGLAKSANERPELASSDQSEAGIGGNFRSKFCHLQTRANVARHLSLFAAGSGPSSNSDGDVCMKTVLR